MRNLKDLRIEKNIFGGDCLARCEDGVVFVKGAISSELVDAKVVGKKGNVPYAVITNIKEASPYRRKSFCKYYGICGGCNWMHIEYEEQLELKKEIVHDLFVRIGKLQEIPDIKITESPEKYYRQRVQFKIDREREALGFYKEKTNNVIAVDSCPLIEPKLNKLLQTKKIVPMISSESKQLKAISSGDDISIFPYLDLDGYSDSVEIKSGKLIFSVTASDFFQSNRFLFDKLGKFVAKYATGVNVADMYGGSGFFSVYSSKNFTNGILVESNVALCRKAELNFRNNNVDNVTIVNIVAEKFGSDKYGEIDTIIVDPPRPGLTKTSRRKLAEISAKRIVYVSCNPSTQARDLGYFINKCGYKLEKIIIFDMYPNTYHIESVAVIEKQ